jgi:hypothetical protein
MKALSIIGLIFAIISIFIPVLGIFLAMACSIFAFISFVQSPTISGITFGVNIISTAFLSPSIIIASASLGFGVYKFYVGFHVVLMLAALVLFFMMRNKQKVA